jgi:hypothetical protein
VETTQLRLIFLEFWNYFLNLWKMGEIPAQIRSSASAISGDDRSQAGVLFQRVFQKTDSQTVGGAAHHLSENAVASHNK